MRPALHILAITILSLLLLACDRPFMVMAGGELEGAVAQPPAAWDFEEVSGLAQLETRPAAAYSINIAYVQIEQRLYVYAGNTRTNWVEHLEQNPLARIRIDETIYPVVAVRVDDTVELDKFALQWASRSVFQRDPKQFDEVWLYRLEPRPGPAETPDQPGA
ncbi:MAG: hypothetical protein AAF513_06965 [Pseudomonadota bacterium]